MKKKYECPRCASSDFGIEIEFAEEDFLRVYCKNCGDVVILNRLNKKYPEEEFA